MLGAAAGVKCGRRTGTGFRQALAMKATAAPVSIRLIDFFRLIRVF
jgi:hypothetical protein